MNEKGIMKQIAKKYESPPQVCPDLNGKALNFGAVFTAFGVLCTGACMALILFVAENLAMFLGLESTFLSCYGVGDAPSFNDSTALRILKKKDDRIHELKREIKKLCQTRIQISKVRSFLQKEK